MSGLPRFLRDLIACPPRAGQGVNLWLYRTARYLQGFRTQRETHELLEHVVADCGRPLQPREIERAIERSAGTYTPGKLTPLVSTPKRPEKDPAVVKAIETGADFGVAELWESSPIRFSDDRPHTREVLPALFPNNPLVCCASSVKDFATKPLDQWTEPEKLQFVVHTPMRHVSGLTQAGTPSERCLDNAGERLRFLVIEFDELGEDGLPDYDASAAKIKNLARHAPLAIAVHSAGKSIHAWLFAGTMPAEALKKLQNRARLLGADPANFDRCHLVRMPDGLRSGELKYYPDRRQSILFFNPDYEPKK